MADRQIAVTSRVRPGRRTARHLIEAEAYRRVLAGDVPATLSEFTEQLCAWLQAEHPTPSITPSQVEEAIRDTWHRRHDIIGSEL